MEKLFSRNFLELRVMEKTFSLAFQFEKYDVK